MPPAPIRFSSGGAIVGGGVKEVGKRQERGEITGLSPLNRINGRIANRVENRVRNRIDQYYDPTTTAAAQFEIAERQVRRSGGRITR